MDAVDVAILRAMGTRPSGPRPKPLDALQPARIARVAGLAVNTVKDRAFDGVGPWLDEAIAGAAQRAPARD